MGLGAEVAAGADVDGSEGTATVAAEAGGGRGVSPASLTAVSPPSAAATEATEVGTVAVRRARCPRSRAATMPEEATSATIIPATIHRLGKRLSRGQYSSVAVSYTHLTLPTNREV